MSQATPHRLYGFARFTNVILGLIALAIIATAAVFNQHWLPMAQRIIQATANAEADETTSTKAVDSDDHAGHNHAGHDDANSLEMSEQARRNIGLRVATIKVESFTKTVSIPGMVVERPGRSLIQVTAPMTGVITQIYVIEGETVAPGQKLFDLRLTHEEIVTLQSELLQTAEELDVTSREITRIEKLTADGALAGKQLLERQYELQKLQATLRSKQQALLLHGLNGPQIDSILQNRKLLSELSVYSPPSSDDPNTNSTAVVLQVQSLHIIQGQQVEAGTSLTTLADHSELYIEGEAFERDANDIARVAEDGSPVSALFEIENGLTDEVHNLDLLYVSGKMNSEARTLDFYISLPNTLLHDVTSSEGRRFVAWRFRPGQRGQLKIPIGTLESRIVLPIDAVAQDGPETFVFVPNGNHFDRRSVHLEYRDTQWAVIANDGALFPGDTVAISAAQQLQLAIKNKAGGGIDPHAGHNH